MPEEIDIREKETLIMDLFKVVRLRRSYRDAYTDEKVSREDLKTIVEAGLCAPSGKNAQTTHFVIIDDTEVLKQIGALSGARKCLTMASAMIACIVDRQPEKIYQGYDFQVEDCAAAVENMLLAITALGYASVWIDGWLRVEDRASFIGNLIGVPADKVVRILLPVGRPVDKDIKSPAKLPFDKRAGFNRYVPLQK